MASFPQVSPPKPCMHLSSPPIRDTCPSRLIILDLITRITLGEKYRSLSYSLRTSVTPKGKVIPLQARCGPDRGTRRGWLVSSTARPHFTPGKDPVPILQEAGWAPGPAWTGGKSRPHWDSIPDRPARSSVAIPTELRGPQLYYFY